MAQIQAAKALPAPEAYRPGPGDPLQRLVRRLRGEDVDAWDSEGAPGSPGAAPQNAPTVVAPAGVEAQLGREVLQILGAAPLAGAARAAAVEVISAQLYEREHLPDAVAQALRRVLGILVTGQPD